MMTAGLREMRVINGIASFLVAVICLAGCSTVQVQHVGTVSGPLDQGDALTVVLDDVSGRTPEDAAKLEVSLSNCVKEALNGAGLAAIVVPSDKFRRTVFPETDITFGLPCPASLASLEEVPQFRQKIDSLRLRYLISVSEATTSDHEWVGGYGVLALSHSKQTVLFANIVGMKSASETGYVIITADSEGGIGFVGLPVIIPTGATESPACKRLGREVVKFISGKAESKSTGDAP